MLQMQGQPLANCLITFLPEPGKEPPGLHSTAVTDENGHYRLRLADQREGASVGPHRVTVQDLSVSTGVVRRDHETVDLGIDRSASTPLRRFRIPAKFGSPSETPLREEIRPGTQRIDLDIR